MKHWILMNGLAGCFMPDSCQVYITKEGAIRSAMQQFDNLSGREVIRMAQALRKERIYYFRVPSEAGAEVIELVLCDCNSPKDHSDD